MYDLLLNQRQAPVWRSSEIEGKDVLCSESDIRMGPGSSCTLRRCRLQHDMPENTEFLADMTSPRKNG